MHSGLGHIASERVEVSRVFNLSFGRLYATGESAGIRDYVLYGSSQLAGRLISFDIGFQSDQSGWENEQKLETYYSLSNKQTQEFNPRFSLPTGVFFAKYLTDIPSSLLNYATDELNETIEFLSLLFSVAQRRRVVIAPVNLRTTRSIALNLSLAGDLIDTVGYNHPLIDPSKLWEFYNSYIQAGKHNRLPPNIENQMKRYLSTFVVPYLDQRLDILWKICESAGVEIESRESGSAFLLAHRAMYEAEARREGWDRATGLRRVLTALSRYNVLADWPFLEGLRLLRNKMTHEYVSDYVMKPDNFVSSYRRMNAITERLILAQCGAQDLGDYNFPVTAVNGKAL